MQTAHEGSVTIVRSPQVRDRVARSSASGANPASICQAPQEVGRDQAHRSRYYLLVSRELINIIKWVMRQ